MDALVSPDIFPAARRYAYLNAASVALMPRMAADAILDWQEDLATRGTVHFDEEAETKVFDDLRHAAAGLLGAQPDEIACASNASEALCSVAWALSPGADRNVVSARVDHPTTVYPWSRVARLTGCEVRLAADKDGVIDPIELTSLIDDRTSVVCVSHVQYSTGQRLDLAALAQVAHSRGAILVVDATQSAGAVPIDVVAEDIDVLVASGYKWLCGPFGAAILFVRRDLYDRLEPGLVGWRSTEQVWDFRADQLEWASSARRFEFGTMAYGCAIGLALATEHLLNIGIEKIHNYNLALAGRLAQGLAELGAEFVTPSAADLKSSIVTVRFPRYDSGQIARRLNEEGVVVSPRIGAIRLSPHLYNTADDIDRALTTLKRILEEEKR
ncbi:MAG: aminotransferase class V-fold PLP-dependent enzyme [Anaerolineae bacterium]|nr:aminotransferase class V-fold PLP-dependent enzyme [Anaerolineae bacterium]NIN98605.1 aminotransferase class V-fold PLP-dependent enzyme [Anaerolineae bacterium]NIQ81489.1 aminotransferase class V-fold PLP-dependent enzyme [Anaerolineae bacterium]